jgi:hypothetical protein
MSAAIAAEALWRVPAMRASMVASDRRRPAPHRSAMAS